MPRDGVLLPGCVGGCITFGNDGNFIELCTELGVTSAVTQPHTPLGSNRKLEINGLEAGNAGILRELLAGEQY